VRTTLGIAAIVVGAGLGLFATFVVRARRPWRTTAAALALSGALVGIGAITVQHEANAAEWVLAPVLLGALVPLNVRLLFGGGGPLRT
jgi:hypothetical protein